MGFRDKRPLDARGRASTRPVRNLQHITRRIGRPSARLLGRGTDASRSTLAPPQARGVRLVSLSCGIAWIWPSTQRQLRPRTLVSKTSCSNLRGHRRAWRRDRVRRTRTSRATASLIHPHRPPQHVTRTTYTVSSPPVCHLLCCNFRSCTSLSAHASENRAVKAPAGPRGLRPDPTTLLLDFLCFTTSSPTSKSPQPSS